MRERHKAKPAEPPVTLKGWKAIGEYLGIGTAAAQRWAQGGMPIRREGRFTVANADDIPHWLGRESHMPAPPRIVTSDADVAAALKESIAVLRRKRPGKDCSTWRMSRSVPAEHWIVTNSTSCGQTLANTPRQADRARLGVLFLDLQRVGAGCRWSWLNGRTRRRS